MNSPFEITDQTFHRPSAEELPSTIQMLTDVFQEYPIFTSGTRAFTEFMIDTMAWVYSNTERARLYTLNNEPKGAAVWHISEDGTEPFDDRKSYRSVPKMPTKSLRALWQMRKRANRRIWNDMMSIDAQTKELMKGRAYIKLQMLGVSKEARGQHIASKLVFPMLETAEKAGLPVVLETNKEINTEIYAHMGFKVIKHTTMATYDNWVMVKEP